MVVSILIGRRGSVGFPGKNTYKVLGQPLCYYPIKAARDTGIINYYYCSTDCPELKSFAHKNDIAVIDRPPELATSLSHPEDVFLHAYNKICDDFPNVEIELLVLLMANCVTITSEKIKAGIEILRQNSDYDSAVTVSSYNSYSPHRARKINEDGMLEPFIPFEKFENSNQIRADRNSLGNVWFADMGVSIVRPECLTNWADGILPQKWMGKNIFPIEQESGFDIDYEYELPMVENWLKTFGGY